MPWLSKTLLKFGCFSYPESKCTVYWRRTLCHCILVHLCVLDGRVQLIDMGVSGHGHFRENSSARSHPFCEVSTNRMSVLTTGKQTLWIDPFCDRLERIIYRPGVVTHRLFILLSVLVFYSSSAMVGIPLHYSAQLFIQHIINEKTLLLLPSLAVEILQGHKIGSTSPPPSVNTPIFAQSLENLLVYASGFSDGEPSALAPETRVGVLTAEEIQN